MASTLKCPFCGGVVLSNEKNCPHCGGKNPHYTEETPKRIFHPKTIGELREYCSERGMPLLRMRFFVGENYQEPKAFGIYKAGENRYVVYKNKADGSRAVRYDGPDEAFAVNELFEKLLSECHNRGIYPDGVVQRASDRAVPEPVPQKNRWYTRPIGILFCCFVFVGLMFFVAKIGGEHTQIEALRKNPDTYDSVHIGNRYYTFDLNSSQLVSSKEEDEHINDGYYLKDDKVYYRDGRYHWYSYIESEKDWRPVSKPSYTDLGKSLYYEGTVWQSKWNVPDFSTFPVEEGYYVYGTDVFYRDSYSDDNLWYVYLQDDEDWIRSDCPVEKGIPVEDLKYLSYSDCPTGVTEFLYSTPYAIMHHADGYYRYGTEYYYRESRQWYVYLNKDKEWSIADSPEKTEEPAGGVKYLGKRYREDMMPGIGSCKESTAYALENRISGYYQKGDTAYYYNGNVKTTYHAGSNGNVYQNNSERYDSWYMFDSDIGIWMLSSKPFDDGLSGEYLGDSYQAIESGDWEEDWNATDFKTSSLWQAIEKEEADSKREAEREAKENQKRDSSDYDSWDYNDTDWDSDW